MRACVKKTRAVATGFGAFFPANRVTVFIWSAAAILTIFCAYAMTVLSDLACNPVFFWKRVDHIADKLGFADAASVAADDDEAPILFLLCGW